MQIVHSHQNNNNNNIRYDDQENQIIHHKNRKQTSGLSSSNVYSTLKSSSRGLKCSSDAITPFPPKQTSKRRIALGDITNQSGLKTNSNTPSSTISKVYQPLKSSSNINNNTNNFDASKTTKKSNSSSNSTVLFNDKLSTTTKSTQSTPKQSDPSVDGIDDIEYTYGLPYDKQSKRVIDPSGLNNKLIKQFFNGNTFKTITEQSHTNQQHEQIIDWPDYTNDDYISTMETNNEITENDYQQLSNKFDTLIDLDLGF